MLKGLGEVRLKKVEVKEREKIGPSTDDVDLLRKKIKEVEVEAWIKPLEKFTPPTKTIALTYETGLLLKEYFDIHRKKSVVLTQLSDGHQILLNQLIAEIDQLLESDFNQQAFAKLSFRSPKDGSLDSPKTIEIIQNLIQPHSKWMTDCGFSGVDENVLLSALLQASIDSLRVCSGHELLALFSASERIYEDLEFQLQDKANFELSIVLREWTPMKVHKEFRCFIYNQQLTGISQYSHVCYYPSLPHQKEQIQQIISTFFETQLKDTLRDWNSYVLDIAVLESDLPVVIELNPWNDYAGNGTSACLFDWQTDRAALENTEGTCEFRVQTAVVEQISKYVKEFRALESFLSSIGRLNL